MNVKGTGCLLCCCCSHNNCSLSCVGLVCYADCPSNDVATNFLLLSLNKLHLLLVPTFTSFLENNCQNVNLTNSTSTYDAATIHDYLLYNQSIDFDFYSKICLCLMT